MINEPHLAKGRMGSISVKQREESSNTELVPALRSGLCVVIRKVSMISLRILTSPFLRFSSRELCYWTWIGLKVILASDVSSDWSVLTC